MNSLKFYLAVATIFVSLSCWGQNYLSQKMNLTVLNEPMAVAFEKLEVQGQFNFSFHTDIIDLQEKVILKVNQQPLKRILNQLLGHQFRYKVVGSHVLIQKKRYYQTKINESVQFSGQIKDKTNQPVSNAIVYDPNSKRTIITNVEGRFNIKLNNTGNPFLLSINAQNYKDTIVYFNSANSTSNLILQNTTSIQALKPIKSHHYDSLKTSFNNLKLVHFFIPEQNRYVAQKLNVFQRGVFQMSLVPTVGTNALTKGRATNSFSVNLVAGYNYAINGIEFGSAANFIQQDLRGVQAAGAINVTGQQMNGVQISGAMNKVMGNVKGLQISGGTNMANQQLSGIQIAGGLNIAGNVADTANNSYSGQIAGGVNISRLKKVNMQVAGGVNRAHTVKGVQIASLFNYSDKANGLQLSSLLNKTHKLNGIQLGIINYADTIENGLQFGLINIVKSGYRAIELSTNESFYANIAYKTGGHSLYTIFKAGIGEHLSAGYGVGAILKREKNIIINADYIPSAVFNTHRSGDFFLGISSKFKIDFNLKLTKKLYLFAGPSFNYFTPKSDSKRTISKSIYYGSYHISKALRSNKKQKWWGWHFGIKM